MSSVVINIMDWEERGNYREETLYNVNVNSYSLMKFCNLWLLKEFEDKCIKGIIYLQLSEMEEKYMRFQRVHIQKYVDR